MNEKTPQVFFVFRDNKFACKYVTYVRERHLEHCKKFLFWSNIETFPQGLVIVGPQDMHSSLAVYALAAGIEIPRDESKDCVSRPDGAGNIARFSGAEDMVIYEWCSTGFQVTTKPEDRPLILAALSCIARERNI